MAHETNITKSYKVNGKTMFYNTPDPKHKTPDMSLDSDYGKQYTNVEDAVKGAKAISKRSGKKYGQTDLLK